MAQQVEAWGNLLEFPDDMSHDDMAKIIRKNESTLNPDYKPKDVGFLGTLKEGAKGTLRNVGAAVDTLQGDEGEVVSASRAATEAPKDPALSALMQDIDRRKKALGGDPGWIDAIKTVGGAALSNPKGAGLLLAEQLPNSAAALAAGGAGALAGSALGPVGTIAGGIAGLFGANAALETGGKAIEAATDGTFSPEEQSRVLKEGAIKGGVITGVDVATLGLTNFITGTTRRAVERATAKTLADHGVDVTSKAAVEAAAKNPAIAESVKSAQELAAKASTTLGQKVARTSGAAGLETVGEGAGEYLGELAATGKADKVDAAVEALAGAGMSAGEITITAARNKAKLETILGKPITEVSNKTLEYTAKRGGERAKAAAQDELNRRATEGVDPEIANAPESTGEAVDRIIATGREKADEIRAARADAIQDDIFDEEPENAAENTPVAQSQPVPDAPTPEPIQTLNSQITALVEGRKPGVLLTPNEPMPDTLPDGVQAAEIPGRGILLYRDEAALRDALDGRMGEALGYGIDEKPVDATHVVTARDANGTVIQDVATNGSPEVERAAAAVAGPGGTVETRPIQDAMAERSANSPEFEGVKTEAGPAPKANVGAPSGQKTVDLALATGPTPIPDEGVTAGTLEENTNRPAQQPSSREAGNDSVANETQVVHPVRPLVESLIKRRAAAKQSGKERALNNAIARAKEVLEGKRADTALESKWFRVQAAGMKNADAETAEILKQIGDAVKSGKLERPNIAERDHGSTRTTDSASKPGNEGEKELSGRESKARVDAVENRGNALAGGLHRNSERILADDGQRRAKVERNDAAKFSRASNKEDVEFAHDFLVELADVDELFRHNVSHKTSLKGVFEDVYPEAKYLGEDTREDERQESGADHRYVFRSPFGRLFYVFERDNGEVFINVAEFKKGEGGQAVYAAVANYAYNDKKRFIGDPAGLTADSTIRRTSNMLSSAIRYGTTKHFEAAPEQIKGDPKNGIEPLDWRGGDVEKIRALIHTFVTTLHNQFPALKGYTYDFSRREFVDRRGRPVGPDRFADAARLGVAQASRAGEATMRRGILIQSLISSESGARSGLLEQVLHGGRAFVLRGKLEGIFSRKKESDRIASVRKRLKTASDKAKQATRRGGLSVSEVEKLIAPLQQAGFKKINIAATQNDLPQKIKDQIRSQKAGAVRGAYIPSTDEIWLVADQLNDALDVALVAMHEARHRGLRKMFGEEIAPIMRQIYATNKRVRDLADRKIKTGMSKELAVEETLADMPLDRARALNGWKKLIRFIKQWIGEKFYLTFTDAMVEQLVAGAEVVGMSEDEVSLFDERQAETYAGASNGVLFSRKPSGSNASWDAPEPSKMDDLIYSLQNKHVDLKRVTESIRETAGQLVEKFNAYLQEELFHGRTAKRTKDFVNEEIKPLIGGLRLRGLSVEEFDKYLHARHAQEANALIAQRDPNMPDGGSGMTNQEARDYFKGLDPEKRRKLDQVAKKVDDIIVETRDLYLSYGLIDQATYDSWESMFKHYVPLMREDKDGGMGIGQGFSIKGKEAKHRTGSRRAVVDILANIALQREKAIVRGEKNRVAVSLYGLAKLNPNEEFWTTENVPQRHYDEATGQVVERADPMFKNRDNVVVAKIVDSKGRVTERAVIFNENDPRAMRMAAALKNLDVDQLGGLMGVSAMITRYFASINTQYNPVFGVVNLVRDLQGSLLNLSSTPIAGQRMKVLAQVIPAIQAIYASSRGERKGKQANSSMAALWDEMQREGGMTGYRDLFKTSADRAKAIQRELDPTAWMNSNWGKIFTAGGMLKVPLAVAQKKAGWLFDWLSDYNQTLEGAMRLSVYKVARDKGLSKQEAASVAKSITVNFNRKGSSAQQAGALYAFFNAAMQGTARIGETMFDMEKGDIKTLRLNRTGKNIIAGGITLGAMQALALAAAGFDDDDPPEFVRERSLIIPIGDKKYITIPMPLGFHVIPNIGRISTEFALGGFKKPADHTAQIFGLFAEAFNPIGSAGLSIQTIAPTAIDPLVAISENRDWTGKPIAKEDFNKLSPTPGFSRNKDTASDPAKWIAEAINTISGGNKYVPGLASPTADQIDYLFGQATGGVGREASKLNQTLSSVGRGEELPPHKIPLLGRFYGDSEAQSSQGNKFYSNLKRINEVEAELKGRIKDHLPVEEFKAENPEYRLITAANYTERAVSNLRRRKSELIEKDVPKEQVKAIEDRITQLMKRMNDRVKEVRAAP